MPIDTSIYSQLQTPDFASAYSKGMTLGQMADQQKKQKAIEEAYQSAIVEGQNGPIIDPNMALSALAKADPKEFMAFKSNLAAQRSAQDTADLKKQNATLQAAKSGFVPKYDELGRFKGMEKDPSFVDPKAKFQQDKLQLERDKYNLEKQKSERPGFNLTEAEKAVDKDFAPDFNTWTSGGAQTAISEINKLQSVADRLKSGEVTTGGATGMLGDRLTSDKVLSARADVESTVMKSLKAILGGAFSEKEGQKLIKTTWNEADSTENNMARVQRLVDDLKNQAFAKEQKARFFKEKRSLQGFEPSKKNLSGMPAKIMQNGFEYTLNPLTGEYE